MEKPKMSLQPSEIALLGAASRIFSAYIQTGRVTEGAENDMIERSVAEALRLARLIEETINSDDELG